MRKTNRTRLGAAWLACAVLLQAAAVMPVSAADSYIFNDTFESGDGGWEKRGGSTVKAVSENAYAGSGALAVTGRTDAWNGAQKDISSYCKAGETYSFSVCACYEGSAKSVEFMLSLVYTGADDKPVYEHLASAETIGEFYVQLANDSYTIPADAKDPVLYVETKSGTTSFYLDEVICAEKGTVIEGPKPTVFTLGDVDYDGTITAADLSLAKMYAEKDFPTKAMMKAADVDQSGTVDATDVRWIYDYLFGTQTAYPEPVKKQSTHSDFIYDPNLQYHSLPDGYLNRSANPGQVIKETYQGTTGTNTLYVYLPVGYDESKQYNIFYLLHGGGENENTLFFQNDTMMQNIFDHMIENGDMEPMIVVTPTWNQTGADKFYTEFRSKVVPFVEGKYSTYAEDTTIEGLQASRYHRAYGGFSMGSVSTWGVLCNNLDIVAYYMPLSGDYRIDGLNSGYDKAKRIADAIDASGLEKDEYYIFCATGSDDIAYPNMTPQVEEMKKMPQFVYSSDLSQGNFYYMVSPGTTHWWGWVRHYIYDILPYFFHEHQNE